MKKTLVSLAILAAASTSAFAQSSVTIYGIMDAGLVAERGGKTGNVSKVSSGVASASRIGFKGMEDLGGGLSAVFVLEGGIKGDTGESDVAGSVFNRQSFVGLSSKEAGTLTAGRQYTPYYMALSTVGDPFAAGLAGSAKNLFPAGANTRASNSVAYKSPEVNGLSADLFYGFGEQQQSSTQRQLGASINYQNGPLNARLAYQNRNNDGVTAGVFTEKEIGHNTLLAVNYDFSVAKAFFMYGANKGLNSAPVSLSRNTRNLLGGVTVPVGTAGTVIASISHVNDKEFDRDAAQYAIGYTHALSKRTSTYLAFAKINNKNGAPYTVGNNSEVGTGDKAFNIGMKHAF